ncbi:hypothetical protein FRB95_001512 [Tulasnella sp. JGI-2019a]|nr:hypothetical protein FRB95_001512 [Tulasnella sp. JGI-2019a]
MPNLTSPHSPFDGVPVGETCQNPGTAHVRNYSQTTLPNADQGNALNPQPTTSERAQQVMSTAQDAIVGVYNHSPTEDIIGSAKDTATISRREWLCWALCHYWIQGEEGNLGDESNGMTPDVAGFKQGSGKPLSGEGCPALGLGDAASEAEECHWQPPIETAVTSSPPTVSQATSPKSGLWAHIASGNTPVSTPGGAAPAKGATSWYRSERRLTRLWSHTRATRLSKVSNLRRNLRPPP